MHMIFHAIYNNGLATCFADKIADNTLYCAAPYFIQYSRSVLYSKHCLQIDLVVGVGHNVYFISIEPMALYPIAFASLPWTEVHGYNIHRGYASGVFIVFHSFIGCRAEGSDLFCKPGFKSSVNICN